MPERRERFLWLYAKQPSAIVASTIEEANARFVRGWSSCPLECVTCVPNNSGTSAMWLFRLHNEGNRKLAETFNGLLNDHIEQLRSGLQLARNQLKRQVNLPTPLIRPTAREWPKLDLGLHAVNDESNGSLTTFIYHEGRFYQPVHLDSGQLTRIARRVADEWRDVICGCHDNGCSRCGGQGCYHCAKADCATCDGTGWRGFQDWASGGFRIDYSTKYPIARTGD